MKSGVRGKGETHSKVSSSEGSLARNGEVAGERKAMQKVQGRVEVRGRRRGIFLSVPFNRVNKGGESGKTHNAARRVREGKEVHVRVLA